MKLWIFNMKKISKRKMESYKRAEMACQELRYQLSDNRRMDLNKVSDYLLFWMRSTENIKYDRPKNIKI